MVQRGLRKNLETALGTLATILGFVAVVSTATAVVPLREQAPPFSAPRLDGGSLSLASLRGHVVVLDFWSPTCPPCALEMPELEKLNRRYAAYGMQTIGVTEMDASTDVTRKFLSEHGITYPIVLDLDGTIGRRYDLEAHPTSVLLDARGVIRYVIPGFLHGDEKDLEAAIRRLLGLPEDSSGS